MGVRNAEEVMFRQSQRLTRRSQLWEAQGVFQVGKQLELGPGGRKLAGQKPLNFGVAPEVGVREAITGGSECKMY